MNRPQKQSEDVRRREAARHLALFIHLLGPLTSHIHITYVPFSPLSFGLTPLRYATLRLFLVTFSPPSAPFRTRRDDRREARRERNEKSRFRRR